MLGKRHTTERGDTLIEVLFAITVFSLIVVSTLTLMNQGIAASQRSLEITLARQQVDGQAETLRFLHDAYVQSYYSGITYELTDTNPDGSNKTSPSEEYYKILERVRTTGGPSASAFGSTPCGTPPSGSFILNARRAQTITNATIFRTPDTVSQAIYDSDSVLTRSDGLWIEGVRSATSADATQRNTGYIDFHIRACWAAPGLDGPMNIGTIVRLYEPRG